ncbi:MAG: HAMP domain-containing histidine kinase, partial [Anaerolineae bacterium]|nr:HAMP domain-containing histidine kinase [Anaerolineae bacterium]
IGQPVEVIVATNQSSLRVSVADRGPGIPEGERDQLFRRFVRLDAQAGEQYGIGLGLYVVKTIVEAHQGRLGVDDRPGGGSVFWFELPVATAPSREGFHEGTGS